MSKLLTAVMIVAGLALAAAGLMYFISDDPYSNEIRSRLSQADERTYAPVQTAKPAVIRNEPAPYKRISPSVAVAESNAMNIANQVEWTPRKADSMNIIPPSGFCGVTRTHLPDGTHYDSVCMNIANSVDSSPKKK